MIKKLTTDHLIDYVMLQAEAYPSMNIRSKEAIEKQKKEWETALTSGVSLYGHFMEDKMTGCMAVYPFQMNYLNQLLPVTGIGSVAVHPLHKKEKTCFKLIQHALKHAKKENSFFTILYPFQPGFYNKMGFGLGPITHQYKYFTSQLQNILPAVSFNRNSLSKLSEEDLPRILDFYNSVLARQHGYVNRTQQELKSFLARPNVKAIAYLHNEEITGLLAYTSRPIGNDNFLENKMLVYEWNTITLEAKKALFDYCCKQRDQFSQIEFVSQDESIPYILKDCRSINHSLLIPTIHHHTSNAGVGLMYSVTDPKKIIPLLPMSQTPLDFEGKSIAFVIQDPVTKKDVMYQYQVLHKTLSPTKPFPSSETIQISLADFSSLCMGALSFESAFTNGIVKLSSPEWRSFFKQLFAIPKPYYDVNF